jgi:hypothetical protein
MSERHRPVHVSGRVPCFGLERVEAEGRIDADLLAHPLPTADRGGRLAGVRRQRVQRQDAESGTTWNPMPPLHIGGLTGR